MPRKIIRKYLPEPHKIKENRLLSILGPVIHDPRLWHLTRYSVSHAVMVGLFCAWIPVPFQMVLAAIGAIFLHANLPLSVALVWITNPVTMPFLFTFAYFVGASLLGVEPSGFQFELTWHWLSENLKHFWQPFLLGCLVCGIVSAGVGYIAMRIFWRMHIVSNWKSRKKRNG